MGGTRRNPDTQDTSNTIIQERMSKMEIKFQEGLDKLRKDYIEQNSSTFDQGIPASLEKKLKQFEIEIKEDIKNLKEELLSIQSRIQKNEQQVDKIQNSSNNKKLLLRGVPEKDNSSDMTKELLNIFNKKMNINIQPTELVTCYRLRKNDNKQKDNKPSPVIVEFVTQWRRDEIFFSKSRLKGSNLLISEVLRRDEIQLFQKVRQAFGNNSWTKRGVSETWLNKTINYENIIIDGYRGIYQSKNGRGGGVGLFIKEVREFNLLLSSMGLAQVFTHPTRVTLQSESLIDLIIMSDNMEVVKFYPTTWKKALVIPKPKKTSPKEYRDLRPISILPCLSKILEKIINEQLINHIEANNILPETQSGFRKYHNCSTTLADITDDIFRATDNGKSTLLVLLDYSRAFDTLDRSILLAALHYIGLGESAVAFFSSYFDGRTQRVMIDGVLSEELPVTRGCAQGSILGATLYIVYTSEQDCSFNKCKAHYYADDTQLNITFTSMQKNVRHYFSVLKIVENKLKNW
ncbi:uncharacterized protein LOC123683034 [Harmonia axyridis]|uniref:uncharacterized protein LOC123683034 n=1 Tax=Harmonia axyridis TaxID=115357 RepID=UPI001E277CC4|nr:uncharacterized protein LOC123683034 [Harmonia axyridis]